MPCIEVEDKKNPRERKMFCISENNLVLGGRSIPTSAIKRVLADDNNIHIGLSEEFKASRGVDDLELTVPQGTAKEFAETIIRKKTEPKPLDELFNEE